MNRRLVRPPAPRLFTPRSPLSLPSEAQAKASLPKIACLAPETTAYSPPTRNRSLMKNAKPQSWASLPISANLSSRCLLATMIPRLDARDLLPPPSSEIVRDHDLRSLRKLAKRKRREEKEEEEKARCSE